MPPSAADPARRPHPNRTGFAGSTLRLLSPAGTRVEVCDLEAAGAYQDAWHDLQGRALEPNVFMEPGFALTAARHLYPARRPLFVLVWGPCHTGAPVLIGLCALHGRRRVFGAPITAVWTHDQATTSAPLLDRDRAGEALDGLLDWMARSCPDSTGLLMRGVAPDGALGRVLAARGPHRVAVVNRRTRAILTPDAGAPGGFTPKQAKETRRQQRRMADGGAVSFRCFAGAEEVRAATERFLELEARGWKGRRGTALLHDPGRATFVRTMTRLLAREGKCRVHSLEVEGVPVAMGLVLSSGDRCFFWKTAYDESRASHSPGKQFTLWLTAEQRADPTVALTDSCAIPDHPMIDRLWRERMIVADILVATSSAAPGAFARAVRRIAFAARCARSSKAVLAGIRRRLNGAMRRVA